MRETTPRFKVGDKVAYNEDGKRFNKENYTVNFDAIVYGIVVNYTSNVRIVVTLDLYNHKGIKVRSHWNVYVEHLNYYEDN